MSAEVTCFWIEPTDRQRVYLRRYSGSDRRRCTSPTARLSYCNAKMWVGEAPQPGDRLYDRPIEAPPRDDPRWPTACDACGQPFDVDDRWQAAGSTLYRRADTGEEMTIDDAPAGAMWNADWWPDPRTQDGRYLVVRLPDGGDWYIDGPAANSGTPWERTGEPPRITARPSILTSGYHGWLVDGVLRAC